jgi:hypothetical protein
VSRISRQRSQLKTLPSNRKIIGGDWRVACEQTMQTKTNNVGKHQNNKNN